MKLSIPSKTFICGEYNVLLNGIGIVVATEPSFIISDSQVIHDPYDNTGGFGLSGAKFLSKYLNNRNLSDITISHMLKAFKSEYPNQSGADIITQYLGGITTINHNDYKSIQWQFADYELLIFKTNSKVDTYKHLSNIPDLSTSIMNHYVRQVQEGLIHSKVQLVSNGINSFYLYLHRHGLVSETTGKLVKDIKSNCDVLAIKGCGTLCNDSIIVLCKKSSSNDIKSFANKIGIQYISSSNNIRRGVYVVS